MFECLKQNSNSKWYQGMLWAMVPKGKNNFINVSREYFSTDAKEYIKRRHGEPFKFLFLPKMGLIGRQVSTRKNIQL